MGASFVGGLVCSFWLTFAWEPLRFGVCVFVAMLVVAWAGLRTLPQTTATAPMRGARRHALVFGLGTVPFWMHQSWFVNDITSAGAVPISIYLALYVSLAAWLLRLVRTRLPQVPITLGLAGVWMLIEILRGEIVFHGYAWYLIAHPLIDLPLHASAARWIGAYGVCALVALNAGAVVDLLSPRLREWTGVRFESLRGQRVTGAVAIVVCFALWSGAFLDARLAEVGDAKGSRELRVGVVQTNLPQSNKLGWSLPEQLNALDRWLELAGGVVEGKHGRSHVIVWPETMKPGLTLDEESMRAERDAGLSFSVQDERGVMQPHSSLVFTNDLLNWQKRKGVPMLVGEDAYIGLRFDASPEGGVDINYAKRFNSVFLVRDGKPDATRYDKQRLTPFGEEMPYVDAWPWLKRTLLDVAARGMRLDLSRGNTATVFEIPMEGGVSARVATPICYEITETSLVRRFVQNGAQALIHVTNDGWFGRSTIGKREHLDICRWRAIEFGVPVVRSANTGISAVIDATGRVERLGPDGMAAGASGADVDGAFQAVIWISDRRTIYASTGNIVGWAGFGGGLVLVVAAVVRGGVRRSSC